jgi:hypothetical protein
MSYARQFNFDVFTGAVADYSREVLAPFDERLQVDDGAGIAETDGNELVIDETDADGIGGPDNYPNFLGDGVTPFYSATNANGRIITIVHGKGDGTSAQKNIDDFRSNINWNGIIPNDETHYGFDINYIRAIPGCDVAGTLTLLEGHNDWASLDLTATDGTTADALTVASNPSDPDEEIYNALIDLKNDGFVYPLSPTPDLQYDGEPTVPAGTLDVTKRSNVPIKFEYFQRNADGSQGETYTPTTPSTLTNPPTTLIFISAHRIHFEDINGDGNKDVVRVPFQVVTTGGTVGYRFDDKKDYWIYDLNTKELPTGYLFGIYAIRIVDVDEDGTIEASDDYDLTGDGIVDYGVPVDNNGDGYIAVLKKGKVIGS